MCCLVEPIALAVYPAKQVAILVSLWLPLCDCASRFGLRWQRLLSAWSVTLLWPRSLRTVFGLTLVFWACSWLCVCLRQRDKGGGGSLMCGQRAGGPGLQSGGHRDDSGNNLWPGSRWWTCDHRTAAWSHDVRGPNVTFFKGAETLAPLRGPALFTTSRQGFYVLKWCVMVRCSPPPPNSLRWPALCLPQSIHGRGPLLSPWAVMQQGIWMCQMKCCGYLSHKGRESGNTFFYTWDDRNSIFFSFSFSCGREDDTLG